MTLGAQDHLAENLRVRQREHDKEFATERLIQLEDKEEAIDVNEEPTRPL
ncbi:hypothetical protein TSAR_009206 [Trichomalopsis sarcophagae]|uniref:Uncharacterized protein n=1 Tax=Trichomalopsis sarcophagae TaxID=543379 RepID=A0A232EQT7_9HYME|nr:hypothetical protein TSAR_009206 [Trichomalopsis sarcophagae]